MTRSVGTPAARRTMVTSLFASVTGRKTVGRSMIDILCSNSTIMIIGLLDKGMQAIHSIEVKYASACFMFYIHNSTIGKCFGTR